MLESYVLSTRMHSDFLMAWHLNWFADPITWGRPALPSAHHVFKLKTKACMSYVFPPSLFMDTLCVLIQLPIFWCQCHQTSRVGSFSVPDGQRFNGTCLWANERSSTAKIRFGVSCERDQESHPVHTLLAISRLLPSTEGYQHPLIPAGVLNSVTSDRQETHSKCHKHNAPVAGDCLFHLKYRNSLPVL